jgi:hypothetical protein
MKKRIFFHTLTMQERKALSGTITILDFLGQYKQPDWCEYPDATIPPVGCWKLLYEKIDSSQACGNCEFIKEH